MPPAQSAGGAERRADAAVGLVERLEVVHVLRCGLAGAAHRARTEVLEERAGLVVDLDDAAGQRRVVGRPDHGDHGPAAGHRHDAVRDDVAALRRQLVVDRSEGQLLAAALDVDDVDPAREQAGHEQSLLIGRVAVVVELVADVRHVDAIHDLAEVSATRIRPDHGDEVRIGRALRDVLTYRNRSCRFPPFFVAWPDVACSPRAGDAPPPGSRRTLRRPPRPAPTGRKEPPVRQWFEFSFLTSWGRLDSAVSCGFSSSAAGIEHGRRGSSTASVGRTHLSAPVCLCSAARTPRALD